MTVVEMRAVTKAFGRFTAVDRVDLDVAAGEVVGLLGANGAGKTTLIRMLLGLESVTSGTVRLFGGAPDRGRRRRAGYLPQHLGLYPDLTADENLAFRARVFGVRAESHGPLDTRGPLGDGRGAELVGRSSLGTQRAAAFAAATQHRPELLVLDEPTSGVSPLARREQWDLIRQHAATGTAILVSTHHMEEAVQADRLVIMANGVVVAGGSPADVVGRRQVVEVVADRWEDALGVLDGVGLHLTLAGRTIRVLSGSRPDVERLLRHAGIAARVRTAPATLDETMVELSV